MKLKSLSDLVYTITPMTKIAYYVCAVCGKTTPLKSFDPTIEVSTLGFIQIREGGGRGSGFKILEEHPLNEVASDYPEIVQKLKARVNRLHDLLTSISEEVRDAILTNLQIDIYRCILGERLFNRYVASLLRVRDDKCE